MNEKPQKAEEKRQHIRIYDAISLNVNALPEEELSAAIENFDHERHHFMLPYYIRQEQEKSALVMQGLQERYPEVVEYLTGLESRIDMLANTVIGRSVQLEPFPTHRVNISASGINFGTDALSPIGQHYILKMQFFPGRLRMMAIVETINCNVAGSGRLLGNFSTGAKFTCIDETDREALIGHIHYLKMKSLQPKNTPSTTA